MATRYAGTAVLVLVDDLHVRVLSTSGRLLRDVTPDPGVCSHSAYASPKVGAPSDAEARFGTVSSGSLPRSQRRAEPGRLMPIRL
jgi:hypothetical protein